MLDWWLNIPLWVRYGIGLAIVGVGALIAMTGAYRGAAGVVTLGVVALLFADPDF